MEPIVNPYIFYIISVFNSIFNISVLIFIITVFYGMHLRYEIRLTKEKWDYLEKWNINNYKQLRKCGIVLAVMIVFMIVIPTEETMYKMLAASYITPDNIQTVQGNVIDFISQIADGIHGVK